MTTPPLPTDPTSPPPGPIRPAEYPGGSVPADHPTIPTQPAGPTQPLGPVPAGPPFGPPPQGGLLPPGPFPQGGYAAPPQAYGHPGYPPGYPFPPQLPLSPGGHRLAEFGDRFLARLIDGLILGAASSILIVPLYLIGIFWYLSNAQTTTSVNGAVVTGEPQNPAAFALVFFGLFACVFVMTFVLQYIYEVEMMFRTGQTFGKRAMKIRVLPVDPAVPLTRPMAFKRFSVNLVAAVVPGLGWLDGLWQLWDKPWRQCLHDKFAQTLVIKLNP